MNRVDVRLVNERKKALRQILKPNYKQHTIYNEDLVGILMGLNKVKLNKPSYVGVAILERRSVGPRKRRTRETRRRSSERRSPLVTSKTVS